jgi:hypothetical protein
MDKDERTAGLLAIGFLIGYILCAIISAGTSSGAINYGY